MTDVHAYDRIAAVRWSHLKAMRVSPKHYRHACESEGAPPTPAMRIGTAIHTGVFEPDLFEQRHPIFEGRRAGKVWEQFVADHSGAEILSESEAARVIPAVKAVRASPLAMAHITGGDVHTEHVIRWRDPETGLECKARVDTVNGHLVELKSTGDLMPRRFSATAERLGYHGQIAFYLDGLRHSGYGALDRDPAIICVEQSPPHDVIVYAVPLNVVESGRQLYRGLLARVAECTASGEWPGISGDEELEFALPAWAVGSDEPPVTFGGEEVW